MFEQQSAQKQTDESVKTFRKEIFDYIGSNFELFIPVLYGEIMANKGADPPGKKEGKPEKSGEEKKREKEEKKKKIREQCQKRFQDLKMDDNMWGGRETIQAVAEMYETNVITMNFDGSFSLHTYNANYKKIVLIAYVPLTYYSPYGDGPYNHYDGVIWIDEDDIQIMANILAECAHLVVSYFFSS